MKRFLIILLVFFILLIGALAAAPFLLKDKIYVMAKTEINKQVNAEVDFGDVGISLLRNFPNLSVSLEDLVVTGKKPFAGDTLASMDRLLVTVDLFSAISGDRIGVRKLILDKPDIHIIVLKDGQANYDIAKEKEGQEPDPNKESGSVDLKLSDYRIQDAKLIYDDRSTATYVSFEKLNHQGSGNFSSDQFTLKTLTEIEDLLVESEGTNYANGIDIGFDADIDIDNNAQIYTLSDNILRINALELSFDGFVQQIEEALKLDLSFALADADFKQILSLIPAVYSKDFDGLKASGNVGINGKVAGTYSGEDYPAFDLSLNVGNGTFKYPDLPAAVENINIDAIVTHTQGALDNMIIDVARCDMSVAGDPIDLKLKVTNPISDPDVDATLNALLDLANLEKVYPLEEGSTLSGRLDAQIVAHGRLSALDEGRYEDFKTDGALAVNTMKYIGPEVPAPLEIQKLMLEFNPKSAKLDLDGGKIGNSDFKVLGQVYNFIAYALTGAPLEGAVQLSSNKLDLNELIVTSEPDLQDADEQDDAGQDDLQPVQSIRVPANIDFVALANVKQIIYDNIELTNLGGNLAVKDEAVVLSELSANVFGGTVDFGGIYKTGGEPLPKVNIEGDLMGIKIQEAYKGLSTVEKFAPVAEYVNGTVNTNFKFFGTMGENMEFDMMSLDGDGKLEVIDATVENFEPMVKLAEITKMPQFKKFDISDFWTVFEIKEGRIFVEPFDAKINEVNMTIRGSNGIDRSIDYIINMEVPTDMFGAAGQALGNLLSGLGGMFGGDGGGMPETVFVDVMMKGNVDDPKVSFQVAGFGKGGDSPKQEIKNEIKTQIQTKVDDAEQKAKDELDKQKQEAEKKAQEELEKQKQEAEKKAQEELEKQKEEAEKKLKGLFGKP